MVSVSPDVDREGSVGIRPHVGRDECEPSASLEAALRAAYMTRATLGRMEDLGQIAAVVVACATALVFALMAWAGRHQS
jgi:hypothetical protein